MLTDSESKNGWKQAYTCKIVTPFQNLTGLCLKDDPFFDLVNSRLSSLNNIPAFSRKCVGALIYALVGRGTFYQSVYKAYAKITFNYLCALFVLTLCHRCYRIDEVSWAILPRDTFLVLSFLWQSRTDQKQTTAKHQRSQTVCTNLVVHYTYSS